MSFLPDTTGLRRSNGSSSSGAGSGAGKSLCQSGLRGSVLMCSTVTSSKRGGVIAMGFNDEG